MPSLGALIPKQTVVEELTKAHAARHLAIRCFVTISSHYFGPQNPTNHHDIANHPSCEGERTQFVAKEAQDKKYRCNNEADFPVG